MAEPRKPRVIRTRPGTVPPAATKAESSRPDAPVPETTEPVITGAGTGVAVRTTSPKVSVVPLVATDEPPRSRLGRWKLARKRADSKTTGSKGTGSTSAGSTSAGSKSAGPASTGSEGVGQHDGGPARGAQVLTFPVPGFKRRRRTILYSVMSVVVVLALILGVAVFSPVLGVRTVVFDGHKLVGEGTLQLAVAPILSKPLPQVTEEEVQGLLGDLIQIKSTRIEARPPSTLLVHIVERVPVALLKNDKEFLLVDQDGVQLGATSDPESVALPVIDGGTAAIGQETFQAITAVLANLPQSILAQLANATAKSPDAVELALADGRSVVWGNDGDMELKAQVLEALLNAPPPTPEAGKPVPVPAKVFDVSAPRHPVTR